MNFWKKLKKPFFCLAPMANVTNVAFRAVITKYGKPDVMWTEFVSADGFVSAGREAIKIDLKFFKKEKPIVVQLFSSNLEKMRQASKLCAELGFDGIDINMGCPDRSIEKQGAGASMMKSPEIAGKIIQAVKDGIKDAKKKIPVSVKTRVGYNKENIDEWILFLLSQNIEALTIHARTRKEMSKVPANWDYVKRVVQIRDKMKIKTKIIGNGDVKTIEQGKKLAKETGCDGIMIGRGIFGNPWFFNGLHSVNTEKSTNIFLLKNFSSLPNQSENGISQYNSSLQQKMEVLIEHTQLFEKMLGKHKNFNIMKKHYKAYVNGFKGAKELREKLMKSENVNDVKLIVDNFLDF